MTEHVCSGPAEGNGWSSSNVERCNEPARFHVQWNDGDLRYWLCAVHYDELMEMGIVHDV
jgi:hypothetical protein